jgi:hypothetical protein
VGVAGTAGVHGCTAPGRIDADPHHAVAGVTMPANADGNGLSAPLHLRCVRTCMPGATAVFFYDRCGKHGTNLGQIPSVRRGGDFLHFVSTGRGFAYKEEAALP